MVEPLALQPAILTALVFPVEPAVPLGLVLMLRAAIVLTLVLAPTPDPRQPVVTHALGACRVRL